MVLQSCDRINRLAESCAGMIGDEIPPASTHLSGDSYALADSRSARQPGMLSGENMLIYIKMGKNRSFCQEVLGSIYAFLTIMTTLFSQLAGSGRQKTAGHLPLRRPVSSVQMEGACWCAMPE